MKSRIKKILEELKVFKTIKKYNFQPRNPKELEEILLKKGGVGDADLNDIDTSYLKELLEIGKINFFKTHNFYLNEWNVSNVKNFSWVFSNCRKFNSELNNWDTKSGKFMNYMFHYCLEFNQSILNFDISNVELISGMFNECYLFDQDLYNFKFNKKIKSISFILSNCYTFNGDVSTWDVSNIEYFDYSFQYTKKLKQNLSHWDVSNAQSWINVFRGSLMKRYPELKPEKFRRRVMKNK